MTGFEMPSIAVPPTLFTSIMSLSFAKSPLSASAASLFFVLLKNTPLSWPIRNFIIPSLPLSSMFPVKPSVTSTSTAPVSAAEPSTLPMKFILPSSDAFFKSE